MKTTVRVTVPATTANLGPGFDALGLALNLRNEVTLRVTGRWKKCGRPSLCVQMEGLGAGRLPTDESNLVVRAAMRVFRAAGEFPQRLGLAQINRIPLAGGLGSSAAATVAGLAAANELCARPLSQEELLRAATEMEGHPDNVAPALLGGLAICAQEEGRLRVLQPRVRNDLLFIFCVPDRPLATRRARQALPARYSREDAVFSLSRAAMMVALLQGGPTEALRTAMQDRLHQPYRFPLVPGLEQAVRAAGDAGALGACLSGSGPTVLAIAGRKGDSERIGAAMQSAFRARGIASQLLPLAVSRFGARIYAAK